MRPTLEAGELLHEKHGIEAEVIDLLTISPLDDALFSQSVRKTGRAVVVHEAPRSFGAGSEIVARWVWPGSSHMRNPPRKALSL